MYVQLEERSRQRRFRRVYNVDLQRDVRLSSGQVHLVPAQVVQCQPMGAGHLSLARPKIDMNLR